MTEQLSPADLEVLEFERATWKYLGRKETIIRERFGHSLTRHFQRVEHLIATPAAHAYDPELVTRLNRLRTNRRAQRSARARGLGVAVGGAAR